MATSTVLRPTPRSDRSRSTTLHHKYNSNIHLPIDLPLHRQMTMTTKLWIGRHLKSLTSAQQPHTVIQIQPSNKPSHLHSMATSLQTSSVPPTDYEIHQINLHSAKPRQNRNRASSQARASELREIQRVLNRMQRPRHLSSLQPNLQILSSSQTPTMQILALRTSSPNRSL